MNCIRRPHAVWTTCPCPPCRKDAARMAKLARNGCYTRVPSEAAWAEVDRLRDLGWSSAAIASAAGVHHHTIEGALQNRKEGVHTFGPTTAARLVNHGDPTDGNVGALGTRRRLQGLARQGWDLRRISEFTGIGFSTLAAVRSGATTSVRARFYVTVRDLTDRIEMQVGPSRPSMLHAEKRGWPGLLAWDDIDTDLRPNGIGPNRTRRDVVAEWEFLRAGGVSIDQAAQQLGVSVEAIEKAIDRAKRTAA